MKLSKVILPLIAIVLLLSSCVVSRINPAAGYNDISAKQSIEQIKQNGLVVIFPTEYKKERALRSMAQSKPSLLKDINKIKEQRAERLAIWQSEIINYRFSDITIVPDSLLKSYIENPSKAMSLDNRGNLKESKLGEIYALYTEYGGFDIKRNGSFIPNPFPNQVKPSRWAAIRDFIGVQGDLKSIKSFFDELNGNFDGYYAVRETVGTNPQN